MKTALAITLCLVFGVASAQTQDSTQTPPQTQVRGQHFEQAKSKHLAKINAHLEALQKLQACVQASTDFRTMRACRPAGR